MFQGYLPANVEWRQSTLERKRKDYERFVSQYYKTRLDPQYEGTFRQVSATCVELVLFGDFEFDNSDCY